MMRAPAWYANWRHEALHELMAKQEVLERTYQIGEWPRYDYDALAGALTFSDAAGPKVLADIQIVGSIGQNDWLWSWANAHLSDCAIQDMDRVREFGLEHGIDELTSDYVEGQDLNQLGWELTAATAKVLGAAGAYRPPSAKGALFLIIKSVGLVS
jgi:hypothetical protein